MAILIEDGTGPDGVESLCSVAAADAYHVGRGNEAAWAPLDRAVKEQLLRRAYDYLLGAYESRWDSAVPFGTKDAAVPARIAQANALLALYAKSGPLAPEVKPQKIKSKVGPIESEFAPMQQTVRQFPDVARLVSPYLAATVGNPYMFPLERS